MGSVVGSILGSGAKDKGASRAARAQAEAQTESTEMQLEYLRETRADIAEAVDAGLIDLETGFNAAMEQFEPLTGLDEYNAARGLLADPGSLMDRPSNQFQYEQGLEALTASQSRSSGGGISGRSMKGAIEYGQNFASTALDQELNRLFPFINTAVSARSNMANLQQGLGSAQANLRVGGATQTAGIVGQQMPSIAQGVANQGNIAANKYMNQANTRSNLYSNIGSMVDSTSMMTIGGLFNI